jgi:hypothetical protein
MRLVQIQPLESTVIHLQRDSITLSPRELLWESIARFFGVFYYHYYQAVEDHNLPLS